MSYSTEDLMDRYGVSRPGIIKFVNAHLSDINKDGNVHAKKIGKEWAFDAEAVKAIDELKNRGVTVVDDAVQADRIKLLQEQITELQQQLLQEKTANEIAQSKIIGLLEKQQSVVLLEQTTKRAEQAEAEVKSLQAQAQAEAEERGLLKAQVEAKENQIIGIKQESERLMAELKQQHEAELTNINSVNKANIEELEKQYGAAKEKQQTEIEKLKDDLEAEKNKSWWQKLWGN